MSNPNGWGDGSVNNNIGWGQGANNSTGWGKSQLSSWSGATDIDGGDLPTNSIAPAITGTAQEGQTLTCSTGTWSGSPTYTYQWKRNGNNIGGATSSTYLLVLADVGQSILCTVTATNFVGSATANSNTVVPTSSVDADAQAFITAASITDPTQQSAINQLVVDLKGYNVWTKMKALYPFVGGTAAQHKWNLKDPRDLDAAFRLVFNGGWTHSSTGALPNGTNAWADTKLAPNIEMPFNQQIAYYLGTNTTGNKVDVGVFSDMNLWTKHASLGFILDFPTATDRATFVNSDSRGNYLIFNNSTLGRGVYKNGSSVHSSSFVNKNLADNNTRLLRLSSDSLSFYPSDRQLRFAALATGFTSLTEVTNFQTAVQAFQTALNRNV